MTQSVAGLYLDQFLFIALPYLAFAVFFIGTIQRYRMQSFTYSSLSSQLLENKQHFWGHGAIPLRHPGDPSTGHVVAFRDPRADPGLERQVRYGCTSSR